VSTAQERRWSDPVPGAAPSGPPGSEPARAPGRDHTQLRPTIFGIVLVIVLLATLIARLAVADPSVAGLVWAGLAAVVVFGWLWPVAAVRMVTAKVTDAPVDLVVGQLASLDIELSGRASGLTLRCAGSPLLVADAVSPGLTRIPLEIAARGAYRSVRVDLGSDAPFGVAVAVRGRTLELPRQLLVGPAPIPTAPLVGDLIGDRADETPRGVSSSGESVRSVRPYVSGDPSHLVHWPTTARVGSIVVRELEPPVARGVAIVVDLTPPPRPDGAGLTLGAFLAVEQAAGRAAGAAEAALAQGARVVLCTVEERGPVVDEIADVLALHRRLALAVDGPPPAPPEGWPVQRLTAREL
jgi:uncharacterized protein (DUF58 family)